MGVSVRRFHPPRRRPHRLVAAETRNQSAVAQAYSHRAWIGLSLFAVRNGEPCRQVAALYSASRWRWTFSYRLTDFWRISRIQLPAPLANSGWSSAFHAP